jgi:hypothetical protein
MQLNELQDISENLAAIALQKLFKLLDHERCQVEVAPSENAHRKPFPQSISTVDQLVS